MMVAGSGERICPWRRNMVKLPSITAMAAVDVKDHTGERDNITFIKVWAKKAVSVILSCREKKTPPMKVHLSAIDLLVVCHYYSTCFRSEAKVQLQRDDEACSQTIKVKMGEKNIHTSRTSIQCPVNRSQLCFQGKQSTTMPRMEDD